MTVARFDIRDYKAAANHVGDQVDKRIKNALLSTAMRISNAAVEATSTEMPHPPVDVGTYRASWHYQKLANGAMVYNDAPHAPFIEYGVRASNVKIGHALIHALTQWVKRKGLVSRHEVLASGSRRKKSAATYDADAASMAWAIAKSMEKRGIFNRHAGGGMQILKRVIEKNLVNFSQEEINREIGRS